MSNEDKLQCIAFTLIGIIGFLLLVIAAMGWRIKMLDKNIINIEYDENREVNRFEYKLFSEALTEIGVPYIRFTFQRFADKVWCVRVLTNNNTKSLILTTYLQRTGR